MLDGLEPFQHPPGREEGHLKGQANALKALLAQLAAHNLGLCVLTTRLPLADLDDFEGGPVRRIELKPDPLRPAPDSSGRVTLWESARNWSRRLVSSAATALP